MNRGVLVRLSEGYGDAAPHFHLDVMDTYEFRVRTIGDDPEVAKWGVGMKRTDVI